MLVAFVGVPASGKSTLAQAVQNTSPKSNIHIHAVDSIMQELHESSSSSSCRASLFDPAIWHNARHSMINRALASVTKHSSIALLDDTFHYTSMRRALMKRARDAQVPVMFVHTQCAPEIARSRNASRDFTSQVPEHVLDRLITVFEAPDEDDPWSVSINMENADVVSFAHWLLSCIEERAVSSVPVSRADTRTDGTLEEESVGQKRGRLLHAADIRVRKLLARAVQLLTQESRSVSKQCKKQVASDLNSLRKSMLEEARNGSLLYDYDEDDDDSARLAAGGSKKASGMQQCPRDDNALLQGGHEQHSKLVIDIAFWNAAMERVRDEQEGS